MVTQGADGGQPSFGGRRAGRLLRGLAALAVAAAVVLTGHALPAAHGALERTAAVRTGRIASADAGPFELMSTASPHRPLRWLACRPIEYRINRAGMPKGMDAVVATSMGIIAEQTGVRFRAAGTTARTFGATSRPSTPTIYISFTAKRRAYGRTFAYPGEIGVGGPTGAWSEDGRGHRYEAITSGRVLLSTTFGGARLGRGATWQSLIVHEVGHALNLAHRAPVGDAMHASLSSASPGRFRPAEVRSLKQVLQRSGCDYAAWAHL